MGASPPVAANFNAATLEPDLYSDVISFTNSTNSRGSTSSAVLLTLQPSAPILDAEPAMTGGTTNTLTWSSVIGASAYEIQSAANPVFANPLSSGWIDGRDYIFTGLPDGGTRYYHVRARRTTAGAVASWSQTAYQDFVADTLSNISKLRLHRLARHRT